MSHFGVSMRAILKRIIPTQLVGYVRLFIDLVDRKALPFFASNRFLSSVYYCFFSSEFRREHQSVLQGRVNYWNKLAEPSKASAMLRRNIHRIEKGLIMRPRRDVFGLAFIEETVVKYICCATGEQLDAHEKKWANDVLVQYFEVIETGVNPLVDKLRTQFNEFNEQVSQSENQMIVGENQPFSGDFSPYERSANTPSEISYEQLMTLCKQRRSVRWFSDRDVPIELIDKAIDIGSLAPSACNRQPFEFYVMTKPEVAQSIGAIPMGTAGFSQNFQSLIVVVGDLSCYPYERDRHIIYIDGSLASMQLMLALETLGLSSCAINWPDIEQYEKRMSSRLQLPHHKRPIMVLAVGYADPEGMIPFSQKKTSNQLMKEIVK